MTLSSAFLSILSAACIAAVAGRLLIAACTAITRPDDALAAVIRWAYHVLYAAQSGQLALAHYRHARDANRARRIADEGAAVRFLCASVLISAHGPSFVHFARDGREWIFRTYDNARVVYTAGEYYDELPKEMGEPWNQ